MWSFFYKMKIKKGNTKIFTIYMVKGEKMKKIFGNKKLIIIIIGGIVFLILSLVLYLVNENEKTEEDIALNITSENITTKQEVKESFYVDIKGNVNSPGVYEFKDNDRVIDAINKAGGLSKNADTSNINLSKKLSSEMVIYVYSKNDLKNKDSLSCNNICNVEVIEVNNCIEKTTNNATEKNNLVNINTANLEDLLTLSGIGESKAKSIIEYRNSNGLFKSIEDIKNVTGIGDALFLKIKDKIKV